MKYATGRAGTMITGPNDSLDPYVSVFFIFSSYFENITSVLLIYRF